MAGDGSGTKEKSPSHPRIKAPASRPNISTFVTMWKALLEIREIKISRDVTADDRFWFEAEETLHEVAKRLHYAISPALRLRSYSTDIGHTVLHRNSNLSFNWYFCCNEFNSRLGWVSGWNSWIKNSWWTRKISLPSENLTIGLRIFVYFGFRRSSSHPCIACEMKNY